MPWFKADLHLHSCLSPCGSLESSPATISATARQLGLDLIALTDHNSTLNCPAFAENCRRSGIAALFGMEATTAEEVHCLCLFGDLESARLFGQTITDRMIRIPNDPEQWGDQIQVNADEEIEVEIDHLLVSATTVSLEDLERLVHSAGGLFIPAHVDRSAFSLMSQLGFVPPGNYDALEICRPTTNHHSLRLKPKIVAPGSAQWIDFQLPAAAGSSGPDSETCLPALICDSDAHYLEDIGGRHFRFWSDLPQPDFAGLKTALHKGWIQREFAKPDIKP